MGFVQESQQSYPHCTNLTEYAAEENPLNNEAVSMATPFQDLNSNQHILREVYQVL